MCERGDGTEHGVAAPAVAQGFAPSAVLLSGKGDRNERGSKQVIGETGQGVQRTLSNPHADVLAVWGDRSIPTGATGNKSENETIASCNKAAIPEGWPPRGGALVTRQASAKV